MGMVYQASDNHVANRTVAIKEMRQDHLTTAQFDLAYTRFEREAAILSLVQNEHLPHIHHFFEESGRYYLVMEYIEGDTLQQQISRKPLFGIKCKPDCSLLFADSRFALFRLAVVYQHCF